MQQRINLILKYKFYVDPYLIIELTMRPEKRIKSKELAMVSV